MIRNNEKLPPLITSIKASDAWLFRSLDVIVWMHKIPCIGSLTQSMKKNQFMLDVNKYIEQLMSEATNDDLQLITKNM